VGVPSTFLLQNLQIYTFPDFIVSAYLYIRGD
jgi:hypothetical protein